MVRFADQIHDLFGWLIEGCQISQFAVSQDIVQGNVSSKACPKAAEKSDDLQKTGGGNFPVLGRGTRADKNTKILKVVVEATRKFRICN